MMAKNKQNANVSVLLRKLHQLGSPVDLLVAEEEVGEANIEIAQAGPLHGASIFELDDGRAGYIFYVDIVNRTSTPIYCIGIKFRMLWSDPDFDWLPDPQERHRDVQYYSFPGKGASEFQRCQVLNHTLLSERGVLQPHVPYQGWLLALGGPMPKHLRHGERVDATLVIIASDRTEYAERICLFSERRMAKSKFTKRESSLHVRPAGRKIDQVAPAVH
jgi:hypothetical protein